MTEWFSWNFEFNGRRDQALLIPVFKPCSLKWTHGNKKQAAGNKLDSLMLYKPKYREGSVQVKTIKNLNKSNSNDR